MALTDEERIRAAHMLAHTGRMLDMADEFPKKAPKDENAKQLAANKKAWAALSPEDRKAVIAHVGPQKGRTAKYLAAAIAALEG